MNKKPIIWITIALILTSIAVATTLDAGTIMGYNADYSNLRDFGYEMTTGSQNITINWATNNAGSAETNCTIWNAAGTKVLYSETFTAGAHNCTFTSGAQLNASTTYILTFGANQISVNHKYKASGSSSLPITSSELNFTDCGTILGGVWVGGDSSCYTVEKVGYEITTAPTGNKIEEIFWDKQVGTTTLTLNNTNTTIIGNVLTIDNTTQQTYGTATIQMFSTNQTTVTCDMLFENDIKVSETRTNLAGTIGSMNLVSPNGTFSLGQQPIEVRCRKQGNSNVAIGLTVGTGHVMQEGVLSYYQEITNTSFTGTDQALTTPDNATIPYTGYAIIDWANSITNNGIKQNVTTQIRTSKGNCSALPRTINAGDMASTGGSCSFKVTAGENFTAGMYVTGTNIAITHRPHLKIIEQANYTRINEINLTTTPQLLKTLTLDNSNTQDLIYMKSGISVHDSGQTTNFYFKVNGINTTIVPKTASNNLEVQIIQNIENSTIGTNTVQLYGYTTSGTATISDGDFQIYFANEFQTNKTSFQVTATNQWNGTNITNFNVTYKNATIEAVNGIATIFVVNETQANLTIQSDTYVTKEIINHNTSNNLATTLYQSITEIYATEISTNNNLQNFSIHTENGTYSTTNYYITIYPNLGTYIWNFTNEEQYFNSTNLTFVIPGPLEIQTIQNLYARDITFQDSISLQTINVTCEQDGFTYNTYPYQIHKSTSNMTCNAYGYTEKILNLSSMPDTKTYNLTPVSFMINFTEQTSGIIQAGDTFINEFNATQINVPQENISEGFVKVTFNPDVNNKYQQIYSYYNDGNTTINEQILIQTVDLQQNIKITGDTQALIGARVCAKFPYQEEYYTTYCDYTNSVGDVVIQVNDQNTYQFCVQAEGYEPKCELHYIPPTNLETITINMISTEIKPGTNYIETTCSPTYTQNENCILDVITYKPYYSICLNVTKIIANTSTSTETCTMDSISETFLYTLDTTYERYNLSIKLDGNTTNRIYHINASDDAEIQINFQSGNNTGQTILEKVTGNTAYYIFIHLLLIILGIVSGYVIEKYFEGMGIYGSGTWFLFLGIMGFYVMYVPAVIILVPYILERLIPLFKN